MNRTTYKDAGVDIDAGNEAVLRMKDHIKSTFNKNVLTEVGTFGGMMELDFTNYQNPVLVSSIDGVGTKLKIAFMMNKHDTVGHDIVNHCVNDILVQGAKAISFLDYFATGQLVQSVVVDVVKGLSEACVNADCVLIGGETAEMPGIYLPGEYDIAGCINGIVEKSKIIDGSKTEPGDVLIGLPSNGLHTNGYSLTRHIFFEKAKWRVDQEVEELGTTLGEELIKPHKSYASIIHPLLEEFDIHGMAHITGGGFYENIPRALPQECQAAVDRRSVEVPQIFRIIQELGDISESEMYRTFNMGIGYVIVAPKEQATSMIAKIQELGDTGSIIGEVRKGSREVQVL